MVDGRTAAVVADRRIRIRWGAETRRATGGVETLPDFIALRRDEQGRLIIPRTRVTALVEAQQAWGSESGTLDAVTATIVAGKLVMPKLPSLAADVSAEPPVMGKGSEGQGGPRPG